MTAVILSLQEQGLGKDARLGDIDVPSPGSKAKQVPRATKRSNEEVPHSRTKRQQVLDTSKHSAAAGISSSEKVRNVPTFHCWCMRKAGFPAAAYVGWLESTAMPSWSASLPM